MVSEIKIFNQNKNDELSILNSIMIQLGNVDPDVRARILQTVATYYNLKILNNNSNIEIDHLFPSKVVNKEKDTVSFTENRDMSPKKFLIEKKPITDVERVACLAYYLTHFRDQPFFKTIDISKLNTEAAQRKFANPTVAVDNAAKMGYLVPATNGSKQLSAEGEMYVQKLPDYEQAKNILTTMRKRKSIKTKGKKH